MARPAQDIAGGQGAAGGDLDALDRQVQIHEAKGAVRAALGSCPMPEGYALMADPADGTFYWLRADGEESPRHCSRWEVWELAKSDSENPGRWIGDVVQEILEDVPDSEWKKLPDSAWRKPPGEIQKLLDTRPHHVMCAERRVEFSCGNCRHWWSICEPPEREWWCCPWCGTKLSAKDTFERAEIE